MAKWSSCNPAEVITRTPRTICNPPMAARSTIGPGITVHGQDGIVGNGSLPLINQGTITSDQAQAITVTGSTVVNLGILQASGGGQLYVNGLTGNVGLTSLSGTGSLLSLGGTNYVNDLDRTVVQVRR